MAPLVTEEVDHATRIGPLRRPLTRRDLSLVFKLADATATLLAASFIADLVYGPRGWWCDSAFVPLFLGQNVITLFSAFHCC